MRVRAPLAMRQADRPSVRLNRFYAPTFPIRSASGYIFPHRPRRDCRDGATYINAGSKFRVQSQKDAGFSVDRHSRVFPKKMPVAIRMYHFEHILARKEGTKSVRDRSEETFHMEGNF